jgi:serine/threonine-protein kinase
VAALRAQALPWLKEHRMVVGGVGGLSIAALAIAAILAATAGSVPTRPAASAAAGTAAPAASAAEGTLRLDIAPWGEVFIDGKPIGVSPPLQELKLPVGRHTVEVRFGDKAAVSAQIDVDPAKPLQIKHRFE